MESFFWFLTNRTSETQFIYNLFHLLLAGLTLMVLLHQRWLKPRVSRWGAHDRLTIAFLLMVTHFVLLTVLYGREFFFQRTVTWPGVESISHMLLGTGLILAISSSFSDRADDWIPPGRVTRVALVLVPSLGAVDMVAPALSQSLSEGFHSFLLMGVDFIVLMCIASGMWGWRKAREPIHAATVTAFLFLMLSFMLHFSPLMGGRISDTLVWNAQHHSFTIAFFAFAWAAGEHSGNMLDRVFVRLNLTFIVLAGLIMLTTVGMEKYQYLRLAEERSRDLAEFLRGHVSYYSVQGESLGKIFDRPEVLRRVVIEFGHIPELREVNVYHGGTVASFRYTPELEIEQEIVPWTDFAASAGSSQDRNSFPMIRLPLAGPGNRRGRIEFIGTMDHINAYIGKYIILIYTLFTVVVGLATAIIGMIVTDADHQIQRQYADLEEAQEQLGQAAKLASVGQLAGGMAHEINNPITSILSLASHVGRQGGKEVNPDRQHRTFRLIAEQAERVSKIVGNLLMFARQTKLHMSRARPDELIETALTLVQFRLREHRIRLRKEFDGDLPRVLCDAGRLTEVFVNVLNNAIDAMPEGGSLTVRVSRSQTTPPEMQFAFEDTGKGIPVKTLPQVFDPFFTTKEPGKGTGLGLSISHGIIKDHGGQIRATSQPGRGTTFVITLPEGGQSC